MSDAKAVLEKAMTEKQFQQRVMQTAHYHGWMCVHIPKVSKNKNGKGNRWYKEPETWRTPYEGNPGLPDLILAKDGVVILAELKRGNNSNVTPDQKLWLEHLGTHGRLWRPRDMKEIETTLAKGPAAWEETPPF